PTGRPARPAARPRPVGAADPPRLSARLLGVGAEAECGPRQPACRPVLACLAVQRDQRRRLADALIHDVPAAWVEGTARRHVDETRRLAWNRPKPPRGSRASWVGFGQADWIRVTWRLARREPLGVLRCPARVHDHYRIGNVGDHTEIMRNHDERRVVLSL